MCNRHTRGSVLIPALVILALTGALAVVLLNPVSSTQKMTDVFSNRRQAAIAANTAAERVKFLMCQEGADADWGTSDCVTQAIQNGLWTPVSYEQNGNADEPGVTFPTIDMRDANGDPLFDTSITDRLLPQLPSNGTNDVRYIAYTTEDGAGNAASYVSAACNGEVINIKVTYHRQPGSEFVHPSYLHAAYAANAGGMDYTFMLEKVTGRRRVKQDAVTGDIFITGNADIRNGSVDGDTTATGTVTGDGTGEETSGADPIPPPDLSKDGEWYRGLGLNEDGTASTNPDVVTDASDGTADNRIAGIILPFDESGEDQPYMDDNATSPVTYVLDSNFGVQAGPGDPTYDEDTDSVIVTVPKEYNNKAIFVPGDLWVDILDPTFIDLRDSEGNPVILTFIVKGNIYVTDGINRLRHPDSVPGGLLSFIALKNENGEGGNIYYGDPAGHGRIDPVKAFLYAEGDFRWYQQARNAGDFDILGNMTAGGIIDFSNRRRTFRDFVPITVVFDPSILDEEIRNNLPCLPPAETTEFIPGSPYEQGSFRYL